MTEIFCYDDFIKFIDVPRETFSRLQDYVNLLKKWQERINLISDSTVLDIWKRHIIDSGQLMKYLSVSDGVIDIGSGAGFPGLVLAILGIKSVTLIESDSRKVAFLKEAARVVGVKISIVCDRVENVALNGFDVITARGFAPIKDILYIVGSLLKTGHKLILLKGKDCLSEIENARQNWSFDYTNYPSITDKSGVITVITNPKKRGGK